MKSGVIFSFSLLLIILARAQENGLSTARELEQNGALKESFEAYEKAANAFYEAEAFEEYASAYLRMANLALQMGNAIQAKELAERTLAFLEVENPAEIAKIAEAKTLLGRSLLSLAQNDDALQVLLVAETKLEESEVKATCLDAIGQAYTNNENFELAAQYLERGLKMRRSLFGNKSIEAGNSFNNLGRVYATEDPLQAIIYFTRALNIYKTSLGENDRRTLRAKINIAFSNRELENYDEAIELLQSVLAAYERQFGKENTNVAFVLSNIGRILKDQKKYEQTLVYQQDALKIYIQLYGEKHQEVANTYYLIGEAHLANQSYKTALSFYQKSVYANLPTENSKSDYDLPEMRNFLNGDVLLTCLRGKAYALEYLHYQKSLNVKDLVAAVDTYAKCDDLITEIRRKRLNERDKFRLGKLAKEIYESGIALSLNLSEGSLRKKKYQQKAFEFCERSKSSVLLEAITESKAKKFAGIPKNLVALFFA
ncbi:MAG: tetratricopeptide repeat protein [Bacteroidota bacterium]